MKWKEMSNVKKIICVIGYIGGLSYFILTTCDIFDLFETPKEIAFPLFSAFWVSFGIQSNEKHARWYYVLAVGYALLALLYIFF